jgi:hypothetical protein
MDKKIEDMDEGMKAMQRRLNEVEAERKNGTDTTSRIGGNQAQQEQDQDEMNPAAMAGAAGGTGGLGTDRESGGDLGASTGTGVHGHVGGTATEDNS